MKKIFVVLAVLFIGILCAGCTSQQTAPVATPTPTPVPTTVAPTEVPTTVATTVPTETPTVNVTATATPTATPTPVPTFVVTFTQDMTIVPDSTIYVKVGTKVVWKNMDPLKPHGVQAIGVQTGKYFGDMLEHPIAYGKTFEATFDKAGAYDYATLYQPAVTAKVVVTK